MTDGVDERADCGRGDDRQRVSADMNRCHACGWTEQPAEKNYRKCPECGAQFLGRWEERTFGQTGDDHAE